MDRESEIFIQAKNKAISIMARRMYTKKELADKLERCGFDDDTITETAEWACEYGFINDAEYARTYILNCLNTNKYGMRRIKQALAYKGVSPYTIDDVLCEFEFDEANSLVPLIRKKLGGNFEKKNIEKAVRHFVAKGYTFSDIKSAVDTVKDECDIGREDDFEF